MTDPTSLAVNLLLAGLLWVLLEGLANLLYPLIRPSVLRLAPHRAARVLMTLALLPAGLALLLTVLVATPGLEPWLVTAHCHAGTGCSDHTPAALAPPAMAGLGLLTLLLLVLHVRRRLQPVLRNRAALRDLGGHARHIAAPSHGLIDHPQPLALTTGLLRPQVWLTQGLVGQLADDAVAIVLAHEAAHQQRRDPLRHLLAGLARLWPQSRMVLADLYQASEHNADLAAVAISSPRRVAETLIDVQRLLQPAPAEGQVAFADGNLQDRIRRLLQPPTEPAHAGGSLALFALALVGAVFASIGPLHHISEWLMGVA